MSIWVLYDEAKWCPKCGMLLFEENLSSVLRKRCSNPQCFFVMDKFIGPIRIEVDWELIKSIPSIPFREEE
jgi:hypothetical protein